jgi:hypothetical protein
MQHLSGIQSVRQLHEWDGATWLSSLRSISPFNELFRDEKARGTSAFEKKFVYPGHNKRRLVVKASKAWKNLMGPNGIVDKSAGNALWRALLSLHKSFKGYDIIKATVKLRLLTPIDFLRFRVFAASIPSETWSFYQKLYSETGGVFNQERINLISAALTSRTKINEQSAVSLTEFKSDLRRFTGYKFKRQFLEVMALAKKSLWAFSQYEATKSMPALKAGFLQRFGKEKGPRLFEQFSKEFLLKFVHIHPRLKGYKFFTDLMIIFDQVGGSFKHLQKLEKLVGRTFEKEAGSALLAALKRQYIVKVENHWRFSKRVYYSIRRESDRRFAFLERILKMSSQHTLPAKVVMEYDTFYQERLKEDCEIKDTFWNYVMQESPKTEDEEATYKVSPAGLHYVNGRQERIEGVWHNLSKEKSRLGLHGFLHAFRKIEKIHGSYVALSLLPRLYDE